MNEIKDSTIGERIKLLRKKRGYNQKELANLLISAAFQVWESSLITTIFGFLKNSMIYKFHDKPPENKNNILKINFNYKRLSW